jgi:hypothetical protein
MEALTLWMRERDLLALWLALGLALAESLDPHPPER